VLGDPTVAGVVILSETSLHAELAATAALAGKHVFVEKPLGVGAQDASEIAAAVEKAGVLFNAVTLAHRLAQHLSSRKTSSRATLEDRARPRFVLQ